MVLYKFLPDRERCHGCQGCEVACKNQNDIPESIRRIRVIDVFEGEEGKEFFAPMPCFHCTNPPCLSVCPTNTIYKQDDGTVLLDKDKCIGCGYCLYACPFGAPQFETKGLFGTRGKMDKCTLCKEPFKQEKDATGKIIQEPANARCSVFCATKALLWGDVSEISAEYRERVAKRMGPLAAIKV